MCKRLICICCVVFLLGVLTVPALAAPPTYASVTVDKAYYEPGEYVKFTISSDGGSNTLWVYYPDGTSKYYQNAGTSYILPVSQIGEYNALVEAWNGDGSCKSVKISFQVVDITQIQQGSEVTISQDQYAYLASILTYIGGFLLFLVIVVLCYFGYKFFNIFL